MYSYEAASNAGGSSATGYGLIVYVLVVIAQWKVFQKAGRKGWESLIPIWNGIVMFQIAGMSGWNLILMFIPIYGIYVVFKCFINIAHKFGQSTLFGAGMIVASPIFMMILGFGNYQYLDNNISSEANGQSQQPMANSTTVMPNSNVNGIPNVAPIQNGQAPVINNCPKCGTAVNPGTQFCGNCGNKLF